MGLPAVGIGRGEAERGVRPKLGLGWGHERVESRGAQVSVAGCQAGGAGQDPAE